MFRIFKTTFFIGFCMAGLKAEAVCYFVNSLIGDDASAGTSIELPWKSLTNLEKGIFLPGDSILFAKGSSYGGGFIFTCSGTAEKPITFSYYSTPAEIILRTPRKELSPLLIKYGSGPDPY